MFKRKSLKLYRKVTRFEQNYGSKMADKIVIGRLWYKLFTQTRIKIMLRLYRKSRSNRILFDVEEEFSGNAKALYEYMIQNGYNRKYRITWLVDDPEQYRKYRTHHVRFIKRFNDSHRFHNPACYKAALKARYVFFNRYFNWLEVKSKDQVRIELWNGCGFAVPTEKEQENITFDYAVVPGECFVRPQAKYFHCAGKKILPIGDARYQWFTAGRKEAQAFFEKLTADHHAEKTILWKPYYRNPVAMTKYRTGVASMMGLPLIQSVADMPQLNELCKTCQIHLIIYCNPDVMTIRKETGNLSNITFLTEEECREADVDLYELLVFTDALLTDFSEISLDYLLLDRPVGYILEDYAEFEQANGFIFDDPHAYMPGEQIYQKADLEQFFRHVVSGEDAYGEKRKEVCEKTHQVTDDYSKRILDQLGIG